MIKGSVCEQLLLSFEGRVASGVAIHAVSRLSNAAGRVLRVDFIVELVGGRLAIRRTRRGIIELILTLKSFSPSIVLLLLIVCVRSRRRRWVDRIVRTPELLIAVRESALIFVLARASVFEVFALDGLVVAVGDLRVLERVLGQRVVDLSQLLPPMGEGTLRSQRALPAV